MLEPKNLKQITYFRGLREDSPALLRLAQATLEEKYDPGEIVFLEGETGRGLYHTVQGRIRVFKSEPGGREQVLRLVGPGSTFNEVPVFDEGPTAASAEALEPTTVWVVPGEVLLQVLDTEPNLARFILRTMATRLRYLTDLISDISLKQVTARVAKILVNQLEEDPILGVGLTNQITGQLTQQQMASMAGTVRDMVGRALRTMQKAGAIEARRGYIVVKDKAKLEAFL